MNSPGAWTTLAVGVLVGAFGATCAIAQQPSYPAKPIRIIVPFPAGGIADLLPRIIGEQLNKKWGQAVVVENRSGAGGNIGAQVAASAAPDGYTLLASSPGPLTINQYLYKKLAYDTDAFVPIALLGTMPTVLLVRKDLPVNSVDDLIVLARKQDGGLTYASQGNGTTSHLSAALFQTLTRTKLTHIPYSGTAPALLALASGQVDILFDNAAVTINQFRAGRIKMLASVGDKRLALTPDVPTFAEAGLPDFESRAYISLVGPPGMPAPLAAQVSRAVDEALHDPDVRRRFAELSAVPNGGTPAQLSAFLKKETDKWRDVIQANHISVD